MAVFKQPFLHLYLFSKFNYRITTTNTNNRIEMRNLCIALLMMCTLNGLAQSEQTEIKRSIEAYFKTFEDNDTEKRLSFFHPELLKHYSEQELVASYNSLYNSPYVTASFDRYQINTISDIVKEKGSEYVTINYSYSVKIVLDREQFKDSGTSGFSPLDLMYKICCEKYGESNVSLNKNKGAMDITGTEEMYGVKDPKYMDWKFLGKKEVLKPTLKKILPKSVYKE